MTGEHLSATQTLTQLLITCLVEKDIDTVLRYVTPNILWIDASYGMARNQTELRTLLATRFADVPALASIEILDMVESPLAARCTGVSGTFCAACSVTGGCPVPMQWHLTATCEQARSRSSSHAPFTVTTLHFSAQKHDPCSNPLLHGDDATRCTCGTAIQKKSIERMNCGTCVDIVEMEKLQKELEKKNLEYNALINSLPCGICKVQHDDALTFIYANKFYYQMHGYTIEEAQQSLFTAAARVIYSPDMPMVQKILHDNIAHGQVWFEFETRSVNKNGKMLWVLLHCHAQDPHSLTCVVIDITDRKAMEEQLRVSEEENRLAIQHTDKLIFRYEIPTRTVKFSKKSAELFALPQHIPNVPQSMIQAGHLAPECTDDYIRFFDAMNRGDSRGSCVVRFRVKNGDFPWYRADFSVVFSTNGTPLHAIVSYEDITVQREKELAYEKWRQHNDTQRMDSLAYYEGNLTRDLFEQSDGPMSAQLPQTVRISYSTVVRYVADNFIYPDDQPRYLTTFSRDALLSSFYMGKRELSFEHRRISPQATPFWTLAQIQLLPDPYSDDVKIFVLIKNIDKQKREALRLEERSQQDALTGLLNRGSTIEQITALLETGEASSQHTFVMVDIDHFKQLNDTLGHQFGDMVLAQVAKDLKSVLRTDDIVGRLGGDEFVICLKNMNAGALLQDKAATLCRRLSKKFSSGVEISGSLGICTYPRDGTCFNELYQKADIALYEAKKRGRNQFVFYLPHMCNNEGKLYHNTPIDILSANQPSPAPEEQSSVLMPDLAHDLAPMLVSSEEQGATSSWAQAFPSEELTVEMQDRMIKYYNIALRNTYDELFELNITRNTYRIVYHVPHKYVIPPNQGCLTLMMNDVAQHMIHPDDRQRFLECCNTQHLLTRLEAGQESVTEEFRKLRENGEYKWASLVFVPMGNDSEDEILLCFITDVDEKRHAEALTQQNILLRQQQMDDERYRIIVEQTGTVVLEYNAATSSYYSSPQASNFCFVRNTGRLMNLYVLTSEDVHPEDWPRAQNTMHLLQRGTPTAEMTVRLRKVDGTFPWCKMALTVLHDEKAGGVTRSIFTLNDVDKATRDRKSLEYRAEFDDLTGYSNFSKYKIDVARLLRHRGNAKYALCYSDLKNFKFVNDIYGYDVGDHVLQYWSRILADRSREDETFARVSADHFTIFMRYGNREELLSRFESNSKLLSSYGELAGKKFTLESVCGIYCIENDNDIISIEDMIDRANIAKKSIKDLGGSRCAFYSEEMRKRIIHDKGIEADMRSALTHNEFCVYLQPLVDIQHGNVLVGGEALVRWNRPGMGLVSPIEFVPLMEKNGFIVEVDLFVFEEVCKYLRARIQNGEKLLRISVNVSRISVFRTDFFVRYVTIKQKYEIPDGLLDLECTETTVVENVKLLDEIMRKMRKHGFLLSLDDFGSGYSSLNMLKDVTVDVLKLDMMFFRSRVHKQRDKAIISSVIAMSKALDMKVVAEGVERPEQLLTLREMGCDMIQGFLFGKPVPLADFDEAYKNIHTAPLGTVL